MHNYLTDLKNLLILWIVILINSQNQIFWFDLTDEVASQFEKSYNWWFSDGYISRSYSSDFPKDPFWDAMTNVEEKSMQLKIAWVQYVEWALAEKRCSLSKKKIWAILYYFVPEFRAEIARSLKMNMWDYDSKKYLFSEDTILKYCREYFICEKSQWYWARETFKEEAINGNDLRWISASTPEDIKTNCKQFFEQNYREWQANEERIQNTHMAQLWSDRYRNETTKDSKYDIMVDLWIYAKLMYQDAEEPSKPVFYDLDTFNDSKKSLTDSKNSDGLKPDNWREKRVYANWWVIFPNGGTRWSSNVNVKWDSNWWSTNLNQFSQWNSVDLSNSASTNTTTRSSTNISNSEGWTNLNANSSSNPKPLPLFSEWWYDGLVEWLSAFSINNEKTNFCNTCDNNKDKPEDNSTWNSDSQWTETSDIMSREFSELSNKEYQDLVDYMTSAVDQYATLPEDKENEMTQKAWDTSSYISDTSASQISNSANKIKNCWKSCNDLRIDLKASCMLKCACWEIESPIFDPEKTPWLWPIFVIRYCTVPSTDTKFSVWWKRIHSIEEWLKEIYWVVDKLSREWRLGIWTQQYNFLDSSTKKMKIADSFAFTIDIEFVDLAGKMPTKSDQYKEKKLEEDNKSWQTNNHVKNPLNNPVTRNSYRIVWNQWEVVWDYSAGANADVNRKILSDLSNIPKPMVDPSDNSDAFRYNMFASHLGRAMDQQWALRTNITNHQSEMSSYAEMLYSKNKRRKNDARFNKSE